jgi:hypothetical protein
MHDIDTVCKVEDIVDVVIDEEYADALGFELLDELTDLSRFRGTEGGGWLVHDDDARIEVDGFRYRYPLALAT